MILFIKYNSYWGLLSPQNQVQINKDNSHKSIIIVNYDYKFSYKVVLGNKTPYKYDTAYKGPYEILNRVPMSQSQYK